jgi:hypothetical protein
MNHHHFYLGASDHAGLSYLLSRILAKKGNLPTGRQKCRPFTPSENKTRQDNEGQHDTWPMQKKASRTHSSHETLSNSPPPELPTDSLDARIESSKWHGRVNLRHKWAKRLPVGSRAQSQGEFCRSCYITIAAPSAALRK